MGVSCVLGWGLGCLGLQPYVVCPIERVECLCGPAPTFLCGVHFSCCLCVSVYSSLSGTSAPPPPLVPPPSLGGCGRDVGAPGSRRVQNMMRACYQRTHPGSVWRACVGYCEWELRFTAVPSYKLEGQQMHFPSSLCTPTRHPRMRLLTTAMCVP